MAIIRTRSLVELPSDPALVRELKSLQRVAGRSGKESVEHPRGSRNDLANAVVGVLRLLSKIERKISIHPHPDLTKSGHIYSAQNTSGVLANHSNESWRKFVNSDGSILPRAGGGGKYWGPVGERG